jgi:hypothetical protein
MSSSKMSDCSIPNDRRPQISTHFRRGTEPLLDRRDPRPESVGEDRRDLRHRLRDAHGVDKFACGPGA